MMLTLPLAACSTGNDRDWIGNPDLPVGGGPGAVYVDSLTDTGRPEAPPTSDGPSLTGLSRENWAGSVMMVPVDTTAATRTYLKTFMWTDATARQRGMMPSPLSSLELSGDSYLVQAEEAALS